MNADAEYGFTNRTPELKFNQEAVEWLKVEIKALGKLSVSEPEIEFLKTSVPYLKANYLDYLKNFKLFPESQVKLTFDESTRDLSIKVSGLWVETILYEIPLLALVSEAYFKFVDKSWSYDGQFELAAEKAKQLINNGCVFSEFGTRRRRSYRTHELVIEGILNGAKQTASPEKFVGTSNVHFAHKYNIKPIGTVAHEWMMGIAAYTQDYMTANRRAMEYWIETLGKENAGVALTDTFGSDNFLTCKYFSHKDAAVVVD